jgi:hypothetical protein
VLLNELARGKLNQLRLHAAEWTERGLETPADFDRDLGDLTHRFCHSVLHAPRGESEFVAAQVFDQAYTLANRLVGFYVEQMIDSRRQEEGPLPTWLMAGYFSPPTGAALDHYLEAFNAARILVHWTEIEPREGEYRWQALDAAVAAARTAGLPVCLGPIIDFGTNILPGWVGKWRADLPTLSAFMCDYLEAVITRYKDRVDRWVVCAGFNHADSLGLCDDDRLRLAARLFESALQIDDGLDLVVGLAQPWGDYLVNDDQTISPFAFADDLVRAGLRLSAVEVDLRVGSRPRGSLPRDLLDTSRLLELYGKLGLPLEVLLSYPASSRDDPISRAGGEELWGPAWNEAPSADLQACWGEAFTALALCNPLIRAVTWDSWSDGDAHLTPSGGLLEADGTTRPLLSRLARLRAAHLATPRGRGD